MQNTEQVSGRESRGRALKANVFLAFGSVFIFLLIAEAGARLAGFSSSSGTFIAQLDERGYRNAPFDERAVDVLVAGDSQAYGWRVEEDETFPVRLEKHLSDAMRAPLRVYNGAAPGWGIDDEYVAVTELVPELQPHLLVLQFSLNDVTDLIKKKNRPLWNDYMNRRMGFARQSGFVLFLRTAQLYWLYRMGERETTSIDGVYPVDEPDAVVQDAWLEYENKFRDLAAFARGNNLPLLLLAIPNWTQVVSGKDYPERRLRRLAGETDVSFIPLLDALKEKPEFPMIFNDGHANAWCHDLMARIVSERIQSQGLLCFDDGAIGKFCPTEQGEIEDERQSHEGRDSQVESKQTDAKGGTNPE